MTIEMTVKCDGRGCHNSAEIEDNCDSDVERTGFTVDPNDGYQHYCSSCWPKVEKEQENE